jgi:hypothetical protein
MYVRQRAAAGRPLQGRGRAGCKLVPSVGGSPGYITGKFCGDLTDPDDGAHTPFHPHLQVGGLPAPGRNRHGYALPAMFYGMCTEAEATPDYYNNPMQYSRGLGVASATTRSGFIPIRASVPTHPSSIRASQSHSHRERNRLTRSVAK